MVECSLSEVVPGDVLRGCAAVDRWWWVTHVERRDECVTLFVTVYPHPNAVRTIPAPISGRVDGLASDPVIIERLGSLPLTAD